MHTARMFRLLFVLLFFTVACFAQDSSVVLIQPVRDAVEIRLPLTAVTSKVRMRQRNEDGYGEVVAPKQTVLDKSCYLEWQIGYDTPDKTAPTVAEGVVFQRKGETKYGYELAEILQEALTLKLITPDTIRELRKSIAAQRNSTLEGKKGSAIQRAHALDVPLPAGFEKLVEETPMYRQDTPHGSIELQIKQRQRAVGTQVMIYVCIPMDKVLRPNGTPRPPGKAKTRETVLYRFDAERITFLTDIVRAFGIASRQHNDDVTRILGLLIGE